MHFGFLVLALAMLIQAPSRSSLSAQKYDYQQKDDELQPERILDAIARDYICIFHLPNE